MKKTGKAGLGHLKKMEKKSRQMTAGHMALAAEATSAKVTRRTHRRCG
jgi:hypothetical protein